MTPVTIYCPKCEASFTPPHTCGVDKLPTPEQPLLPKPRTVEDMTDQEIETLRAELVKRDERNRVRGMVHDALVFTVTDPRMEPVAGWVETGIITQDQVVEVFRGVLREWLVGKHESQGT